MSCIIFNQVSSFTGTEYLVTFLGILYAFGIIDFIRRNTLMITYFKKVTFCWELYFWNIFCFMQLLAGWYTSWFVIDQYTQGFVYFLCGIASPIMYVMIFPILMPRFINRRNLKVYFQKNKKKIFIILLISATLEIFELAEFRYYSYNLRRIILFSIFIILDLIALISKKRMSEIIFLFYFGFATIYGWVVIWFQQLN